MTTTIPAPESLEEARHWLTLESHLGDQPATARRVLDHVEAGHPLDAPATAWLKARTSDRECGAWCRKILGGAP